LYEKFRIGIDTRQVWERVESLVIILESEGWTMEHGLVKVKGLDRSQQHTLTHKFTSPPPPLSRAFLREGKVSSKNMAKKEISSNYVVET